MTRLVFTYNAAFVHQQLAHSGKSHYEQPTY